MERLITSPQHGRPSRRGVLLLLVLSLLTLFMMLGATYLVIATRARATATAFANATSGAQSTPTTAMGQAFVDAAFLRIVRGSAGGASGVISNADTLLGDKYGLPSSGTTTTGTLANGATSGAIIISTTATVTGTDAIEALSGRVLTFTVPGLTNASTRILRAEPAGGYAKLFLPAGPTLSGANLTSTAIESATAVTGIGHFVINGREFSSGTAGPNEAWDGYDSNNDFLANPLTPTTRPSFSASGTLGTSGANLFVDNDGDGVLDSGWLDIGLPPIVNVAGQTLYPRAAILITDLDGRLNVNAHGSRSELDNPSSLYNGSFATGPNALTNVTSATSSFVTLSLSKYPRGRGVGPAEIALESSGLFESASGSSGRLAMTGVDSIATATDPKLQRTPPKVGAAEGRYGGAHVITSSTTFPRPGAPYKNDTVTSLPQSWISASGTSYFTKPLRHGSPPDLKASTSIFIDDFGQPVYYRPYWTFDAARPANVDDESIDDPYEINLSRLGPRSGSIVNASTRATPTVSGSSSDYRATAPFVPDNLFTAGDLEGLLRAYDIDAPKLSRRLPAICGTKTGVSRLMLTTDSWDTSAMPGTARAAVSRLIAISGTATGMSEALAMSMFAPETLMGHKLDLNRPFHDTNSTEPNNATGTSERLAFAKHFYCLAFAIAGNGGALDTDPIKAAAIARELAQWAINVVDFRDADSVLTGFEYDTDITNGWSVNGDLSDDSEPDRDVVWGTERPEVLISETICWHDRRTDDMAFGSGASQNYQVVDWDPTKRDGDFDQQRRPQGCFLFELYSPWGSQLAEVAPSGQLQAVRRDIMGASSTALRADPIPLDISTATGTAATGVYALDRFDPAAAVNLSGTTANGYPIWRVLTLKSGTGLPAVTDPATAITGTVWRSFYFTKPPVELVRTGTALDPASGTSAVAFWPSKSGTTTISLNPQEPTAFGSGTATGGPAGTVVMDTLFKAPSGLDSTAGLRVATLTEPLLTRGSDASLDAYTVLAAQSTSGAATFPLVAPADTPLDNKTYDPPSDPAGIANLIGVDGNNTLLQNGRHANYFLMHLQRVANPLDDWDTLKNPYVTVDTQPIDLIVFNTGSASTFPASAPNYDEPLSALPQRKYDVAQRAVLLSATQTLNVQRGNTQVSGTTDHDIWSARINPEGATDELKLLSISSDARAAEQMNPLPNPATHMPGVLVSVPAPPKNQHTLGALFRIFGTGSSAPSEPFPWMMWANRPYTSVTELSLVPRASSFQLLRLHNTAAATNSDALDSGVFGHLPRLLEPTVIGSATAALSAPWDAIAGRNSTTGAVSGTSSSIWDVVHVPTPFGGSYQDVPLSSSSTAALALIGLDKRPYGQLPNFREPGRINVNTITGTAVWTALLGSGTAGTAIQSWTPTAAPFDTPARTLLEALGRYHPTVSGTTSFIDTYTEASRDAATNAFFRYQTVNRLTNLTTIRSNVFAVWVTIGYSTSPYVWNEAGSDTGDIRRHRGFYIFDRSIPVGFDPGKDLNVRDAILLRRIIQ